MTPSLFQTVADEKRVVDEQRRTLDEEIADFQRRKVERFFLFLHLHLCCISPTLAKKRIRLKAPKKGHARKGSNFF